MSRRIKTFGGQHETRPIKDVKQLQQLFYYLLNQIEVATKETENKRNIKYFNRDKKIPQKVYQADRNWMLFLVGMNTAFRAEDLLQLRVCDVIKGYISIKEFKTGKMQNFRMNKQLHEDIKCYVERNELLTYDYLFMGQKKLKDGRINAEPIERIQGHRIVSSTGRAIGIPFVFGLHSLRKTFGYQYIKKNSQTKEADGASVLTLMKMYNHESPDITLRYICWSTDDAENARTATYIGGYHKK